MLPPGFDHHFWPVPDYLVLHLFLIGSAPVQFHYLKCLTGRRYFADQFRYYWNLIDCHRWIHSIGTRKMRKTKMSWNHWEVGYPMTMRKMNLLAPYCTQR